MSIYTSGSTLRMTGMASGWDTDALIKSMLQIEQLKVDREYRAKVNAEWKSEALKGVSGDLEEFSSTYMKARSANNMLTSKAYLNYNVICTGNDDSAVEIFAGPGAADSSFVINNVLQLAKAAGAATPEDETVSKSGQLCASNNTRLGACGFARDLFTAGDNVASFSINGKVFEFTRDDTLQDMLDTVNNSSAGVVMKYSRLTDSFSVESKVTGSVKADGKPNTVSIVNIRGNAFGVDVRVPKQAVDSDGELMFEADGTTPVYEKDSEGKTIYETKNTGGALGIRQGTYRGQDAKFMVDGRTVTSQTNELTVDGVTFRLNAVTTNDEGTEANIRVKINFDPEPAVENIKNFVEGYNTLITKLNGLLSERKTKAQKSYGPLTEEEKAAMTEEQIKTWEEVAKIGLLGRDEDLRKLISDLRMTFYDTVEASGFTASELGIITDPLKWRDGAVIEIKEDVLREALAKNPEAVMKTFANVADPDLDPAEAYKQNGLVTRMQVLINDYSSKVKNTTQKSLTKKIGDYDDQIEKLEKRMDEIAERYYLKFAAMEKMLSQLQGQADWMTSMLGSQ